MIAQGMMTMTGTTMGTDRRAEISVDEPRPRENVNVRARS
jgi:hypothetical protein